MNNNVKPSEASVSGVLFLSFLKACSNLEYYVDDKTLKFLSGVTLDGWYPLEEYKRLLTTVSSRYSEPGVILESLGAEMMRVWYFEGPGQSIINTGVDFLRHQTGSEGYHSLIQGPADIVGDFSLVELSEADCHAVVVSSTPFDRDLERGVLASGVALTGDLGLIRVDNTADPNRYDIRFARLDDVVQPGERAIDVDEFFGSAMPPTDARLDGVALRKAYMRTKELEAELDRQKRFWHSANRTLSEAMTQIRSQQDDLVQANEALAAASSRNQLLKDAVVDAAFDAVITVDANWIVREFNVGAERMFGSPRAEVIDQPVARHYLPAEVVGLIDSQLDGRHQVSGSATASDATGREFPVDYSLSRVMFQDSALYTLYLRDISDRLAAEEQIEKQRNALIQSEKLTAMGSLLAGVAHELNNPLSIVVGRSAMLLDQTDDPVVVNSIEKVRAATERSMRIVKSFLAMARKQTPERSRISVEKMLDDSIGLLEYGYRTSGIELRRQLDPGLPDLFVDSVQLQQVFTNLFINAQQALSEVSGQRVVSVRAEGEATGSPDGRPSHVVITISDSGPGIPADIRDRIFEPFFTTKPLGTGTGVGLSLSHGIIASHGGSIALGDDSLGGACFVIRLPCEAVPEETTTIQEEVMTQTRAARVLIVDDEADIADMVREMLSFDGHEAELADSGIVALELLEARGEDGFDLILCDMNMAQMGGEALYGQLKSRFPAAANRIAFITGDSLSAATQKFLEESQRPCLEKPFTPAELREGVEQWLAG